MSSIKGIDVSHHNGKVDWRAVKKAGIDFAFIKATEGTSFVDSEFDANRKHAAEAGLVVGFYHFGHPDNDPADEADFFCKTVGKLAEGELPLVLDLEAHDTRTPAAVQAWAHRFLHEVKEKTGREPILYTYPSFISEQLGESLCGYRLWIASYRDHADTRTWSRWLFWQDSDAGEVPGVGKVDTDVFHGTLAELEALAGVDHKKPVRKPHGVVPDWFHRNLHLGNPMFHGDDVKVVQAKVGVAEDGKFGKDTEAAVRRFQSAHKLTVDGIVGKDTAVKIGSAK